MGDNVGLRCPLMAAGWEVSKWLVTDGDVVQTRQALLKVRHRCYYASLRAIQTVATSYSSIKWNENSACVRMIFLLGKQTKNRAKVHLLSFISAFQFNLTFYPPYS